MKLPNRERWRFQLSAPACRELVLRQYDRLRVRIGLSGIHGGASYARGAECAPTSLTFCLAGAAAVPLGATTFAVQLASA